MKVDYNPYEGRTVQGSPSTVICGGEVVIDGDTFVGRKGGGRFLKRGPSQAPAGL
jgi:dihydropyrimidinase